MKRNISENARAEIGENFLTTQLYERSAQKFQEGVRTTIPFRMDGKPLTGDYLVSTYIGGCVLVVTTRREQWLVMTDEQNPDAASTLRKVHEQIATPFGFIPDND